MRSLSKVTLEYRNKIVQVQSWSNCVGIGLQAVGATNGIEIKTNRHWMRRPYPQIDSSERRQHSSGNTRLLRKPINIRHSGVSIYFDPETRTWTCSEEAQYCRCSLGMQTTEIS